MELHNYPGVLSCTSFFGLLCKAWLLGDGVLVFRLPYVDLTVNPYSQDLGSAPELLFSMRLAISPWLPHG